MEWILKNIEIYMLKNVKIAPELFMNGKNTNFEY